MFEGLIKRKLTEKKKKIWDWRFIYLWYFWHTDIYIGHIMPSINSVFGNQRTRQVTILVPICTEKMFEQKMRAFFVLLVRKWLSRWIRMLVYASILFIFNLIKIMTKTNRVLCQQQLPLYSLAWMNKVKKKKKKMQNTEKEKFFIHWYIHTKNYFQRFFI